MEIIYLFGLICYLQVEKTNVSVLDSSSDFGDSPIKSRNVSMNESAAKKRKLILESDDSEPDLEAKKTQKKSPSPKQPSPKKTASGSKAANKENESKKESGKKLLRLSSSSSGEEDVVVEKEAKKSRKKASKKEPTSPKSAKKSTSSKKEASPSKNSPKKEPETVEKTEPAKANISNFFSKSTSVFSNGKKVQANESSKTSGESKAEIYSPNKDDYHPINDASWEKGAPVPYQALAQTLYCMEKTTKRLELLAIVSNYFRSLIALSPKDIVPSIFMLTNKVAPDYENIELGIGDTVLFKALAEATGCTVSKLKNEFQSKGDIGLVAEVLNHFFLTHFSYYFI